VADALAYGVKVTGCTVHFVDEGMDTGPIILQEAIPVNDHDTRETLHQRIQVLEHKLYPQAIKLWLEGRLKIEGRRCLIDDN
jgi:phosphoribosylglycinamide formyltransferase-1